MKVEQHILSIILTFGTLLSLAQGGGFNANVNSKNIVTLSENAVKIIETCDLDGYNDDELAQNFIKTSSNVIPTDDIEIADFDGNGSRNIFAAINGIISWYKISSSSSPEIITSGSFLLLQPVKVMMELLKVSLFLEVI